MTTMQAIRAEHQHLLPHIEELRTTAEQIGTLAPTEVAAAVGSCLAFLEHHLVPHALAEDEVLYPVVGRLLGDERATATMRRDHVEVGRLTAELAAVAGRIDTEPDSVGDVERLLFGLHAIVRLHFAKEEEVYIPMLEAALDDDEVAAIERDMEAAAHRVSPHR